MLQLINLFRRWEKESDNQFLPNLEYNPEAEVVDLGCGNGDFTLTVNEQIRCKHVYGVDVYDPALEKATTFTVLTVITITYPILCSSFFGRSGSDYFNKNIKTLEFESIE